MDGPTALPFAVGVHQVLEGSVQTSMINQETTMCHVTAVGCGVLPHLPANITAGWPANCSSLPVGGVCRTNCSTGFLGGFNTSCLANGTWSAVVGACVSTPSGRQWANSSIMELFAMVVHEAVVARM